MAVKAFDVFVMISVCIYSRNISRIYLRIFCHTYLFLVTMLIILQGSTSNLTLSWVNI